jgi:hypothetical protein
MRTLTIKLVACGAIICTRDEASRTRLCMHDDASRTRLCTRDDASRYGVWTSVLDCWTLEYGLCTLDEVSESDWTDKK